AAALHGARPAHPPPPRRCRMPTPCPRLRFIHPRPLLLVVGSLLLAASWALAENLISPDDGTASGGSTPDATWSSYGVSSKRSVVAVDSRAARIILASGDHASLARIADPGAAPNAVLCTFNVFCTGGSGPQGTEVVRFGKNFSLSNIDEPDANTYARIG